MTFHGHPLSYCVFNPGMLEDGGKKERLTWRERRRQLQLDMGEHRDDMPCSHCPKDGSTIKCKKCNNWGCKSPKDCDKCRKKICRHCRKREISICGRCGETFLCSHLFLDHGTIRCQGFGCRKKTCTEFEFGCECGCEVCSERCLNRHKKAIKSRVKYAKKSSIHAH